MSHHVLNSITKLFMGLSLLVVTTANVQAKPKRQYNSCAVQSKNVIKTAKIKTYKKIGRCTVQNAARDEVRVMNFFFKTILVPAYKKSYNKQLRKMMRKDPKKRALLRRRQLARISMKSYLVSVRGKVYPGKKCRIKITRMIIKIKSCGLMKR